MSIVVANELEGLKSSKKEKTARAAEEALSYVKANNITISVSVGYKLTI